MAKKPSANARLTAAASARAAGLDNVIVVAAVPNNTSDPAKVYSNAKSIYDRHGYAKGVDYCRSHIEETGKPVIFVPVPIATQGTLGQIDQSGNTNTSVVSITAGADGPLDDTDGAVRVEKGGVVGTDQIILGVSNDAGRTYRTVRVGTATSYELPYVGLTLALGAGSLTAGQVVLRWKSTGPAPDAAGYTLARTKLSAKQLSARSWLMADDLATGALAAAVVTEINAYATLKKRYLYARGQVYDRPQAKLSTTALTLTFAAAADTITREEGSWLDDGFVAGMTVPISGTDDNDGEHTAVTVTDLVLTVAGSPGLVDETIEADAAGLTITGEIDKASHVAAAAEEYEDVIDEERIDLSIGRAFKQSAFLGHQRRWPASWLQSIREYQHDPSVCTWQKQLGALSLVSLEDASGELVEYDEEVDGGALEAQFSCLMTYPNDLGVYVARSLTRGNPNTALVNTHHMAVANIACTITQRETEFAIGMNLEIRDGKATPESLSVIKTRVDSALGRGLLRGFEQGPRASQAYWTPSTDDDLSGPDPKLTGVTTLELNSTIVEIDSEVRVNP